MLTGINIQILENLVNLYLHKDKKFKINFNNLSEEESISALNYMLQLFDLDSGEFEEIYSQLGISKYCELSAIKDIKYLRKMIPNNINDAEEQKQLISKLINYSINGVRFKKYVYSAIVDVIVRFRLLADYIEFVEMALQVIKDKTIPDINIFLNTEVNK